MNPFKKVWDAWTGSEHASQTDHKAGNRSGSSSVSAVADPGRDEPAEVSSRTPPASLESLGWLAAHRRAAAQSGSNSSARIEGGADDKNGGSSSAQPAPAVDIHAASIATIAAQPLTATATKEQNMSVKTFLKKAGEDVLKVITFGEVVAQDAAPFISLADPALGTLITTTVNAIVTAQAAGTVCSCRSTSHGHQHPESSVGDCGDRAFGAGVRNQRGFVQPHPSAASGIR